jgi:AraC-like DNA-binding protein
MNSRLDLISDWPSLAGSAGYCSRNLARLCRVSPRQIERYFQLHHGQSPHHWLRELRLRRAVELIREGAEIKYVAQELCYGDVSHFSRDFKEYFGLTPGAYVRQHLTVPPTGPMSRFDNKCRV